MGLSHTVNELSTAQDRPSQVSGPGWQVGSTLSVTGVVHNNLYNGLRSEE